MQASEGPAQQQLSGLRRRQTVRGTGNVGSARCRARVLPAGPGRLSLPGAVSTPSTAAMKPRDNLLATRRSSYNVYAMCQQCENGSQ